MSRVVLFLLVAFCCQRSSYAQESPENAKQVSESTATDIRLLESWPDREGRAASRRLSQVGEQISDRLLELLQHRDWRFRAGAAHALGLIGERRAFSPLRNGLRDVGNRIALGTYFEAMVRLDAIAGSAEVLPYLRSPSPRTSKAAFDALPDRLPASLRTEIEALWTDKSQLLRLRGLELALRLEPPPSRKVLFRFLGDRHPKICRLVAQILGDTDDAELVKDLNRLIREGGLRQASYAVIALVMMEDRTSSVLIESSPDTLKRLRRFLRIRGGLERAAGAIGLANISMKSDDPLLRKLADERLMFHLIDSMAGGVLYNDFGAIQEVCLSKATMLSGLTFGDHADKWRRWWIENGKTFVARRALSSVGTVAPEQLRVEVQWTTNQRQSRQSFSGADGRDVAPRMPRPLFLSRDEMNELIRRLDASLFSSESGGAALSESEVTIHLRASRAERLRRFGKDRGEGINTLLSFIDKLDASLMWQRFWSPRNDGRFQDYLKAWRLRPIGARQSGDLASRALGCFDELSASGREYALSVFKEQGESWVASNRDRLLGCLKSSGRSVVLLERWTHFLLKGASPKDVGAMLDVVAQRGATCTTVVRSLLLRLPKASMTALRSDRRSVVRAAIVPILLSQGSDDVTLSQLIEMLRDPSAVVQESLAEAATGNVEFRARLMAEVRDGGLDRGPALTVLGATRSVDIVPFLSSLLQGSELPVGLAAIHALSAAGTPAALDALFQLVEGWDDDVLAASALGALGEDARPQVRQRMRALLSAAKSKNAILRLLQVASGLLSDTIEEDFKLFCLHDDLLVRRRSAELIVDHMGASGIPVLIQLLSDPGVLESVRARLELITCHVLPATGHIETQRAYTEWWDAHQGEAPSLWFLRALQRTGQVRGDVEGVLKDKRRDPSAIKTLVDLIEKTESWQLRVRAHKALNRLRDTPIRPVLRRHSTQGDITLAVKRWRKWLDRLRAGLAK